MYSLDRFFKQNFLYTRSDEYILKRYQILKSTQANLHNLILIH